jgi:hypothetical protein
MSAAERIDRVPEIKRALTDVRHLCGALDLLKGSKRQPGGGLMICCPKHGERHASCSVTVAPDGTVRVRCFSCDFAGDALHLVAMVRGLHSERDFPDVLREAAAIAGLDFAELGAGRGRPVPPKQLPARMPDRSYPLASEVASVWQRCVPVSEHRDAAEWLTSRGLDIDVIALRDLARAIPDDETLLPAWARYQGRTWFETGHRLLLPVFDHAGVVRSVRAAQVVVNSVGPKRLPPAGHLAAGLLLANKTARALFGHGAKADLLIVEGEPDFLTWASTVDPNGPPLAIVGIGSGSWTHDYADRVPVGTRVVIRTHLDAAGDKYAADVARSLVRRCKPLRPAQDGLGDENDRLRAGKLAARFDAAVAPMTVDAVDPASFPIGRLFAEYYWLGPELRPGVFAARCPGEILHTTGRRFDGASVVRAPAEGKADGQFRCSHPPCRGIYDRRDVLENMIQRIAQSEGL